MFINCTLRLSGNCIRLLKHICVVSSWFLIISSFNASIEYLRTSEVLVASSLVSAFPADQDIAGITILQTTPVINEEPGTPTVSIKDVIRVTKLFLINSDTGNNIVELVNDTQYDIKTIGTSRLTIRAETNDPDGCGWVVFDFDNGLIRHTDLNEPFTLGGNDTMGNLNTFPSLTELGIHTLRVTPSVDGTTLIDLPVDQQTIPIVTDRPKFKSCWNIEEFAGVTADLIISEPTEGEGEFDVEAPAATSTSIIGDLFDWLKDRGTNNRRNLQKDEVLKGDNSAHRHTQTDMMDAMSNDGSMFITFSVVSSGNITTATIAPTPAPVPNYDIPAFSSSTVGSISGTLQLWNKITFGFTGPATSELGSSERGPYGPLNTFRDYRVDLFMEHLSGTGRTMTIPGYFALDGDAANSIDKGIDGSVWLAHFVPDQPGDWKWTVSFRMGENCAPNGGGDSAGYFDGVNGTFFVDMPVEISPINTTTISVDLRSKGRLQYVSSNFLQFVEAEEYFIAMGPSSPQNVLAYRDFDNTPNNGNLSKSLLEHEKDYMPGDTTWSKGNGTEIIGAINYLAGKGMTVLTVTTLTVNGPDKNVFPLTTTLSPKINYDVSKLSQWDVIFDHTERKGMALRVILHDSNSLDFFDNQEEIKTYYREMIARFGHHLGMIWDIGESIADLDQIRFRSDFIRSIDPYRSPILVQTMEGTQDIVYRGLLGYESIDCITIQSSNLESVGGLTSTWIAASRDAGKPWVVLYDGQGSAAGTIPSSTSNDADAIVAKYVDQAIWANLMNGGSGNEFYFGNGDESDLTLQNYRSRDSLFTFSFFATNFFRSNDIALDRMYSLSDYVAGYAALLPQTSEILQDKLVVYKFAGITQEIVLSAPGLISFLSVYSIRWFDPRTGNLVEGSVLSTSIDSNTIRTGLPPYQVELQWVCYFQCIDRC